MTVALFAVVEHNQASHQPDGETVPFCATLTEAVVLADELTAENRSRGRRERFAVYRMDEVDESELYDWAVQDPNRIEPLVYTHEYAARSSCPTGHMVVRRRLGTTDWIPAPEEER